MISDDHHRRAKEGGGGGSCREVWKREEGRGEEGKGRVRKVGGYEEEMIGIAANGFIYFRAHG